MANLSEEQLLDLKDRAVKAFKQRRQQFFTQEGLKQNFPWLTEELVRKQVEVEKLWKVDMAIAVGYAAVLIALSAPIIFDRSYVQSGDAFETRIRLAEISALGAGITMTRVAALGEPILNAYRKATGGWKGNQEQIDKRERLELDKLISG